VAVVGDAEGETRLMSKPMRIIDVHQHVFWHGHDDGYLVANMDEHGIDKAVVLTWVLSDAEGETGFDAAFNPANSDPQRRHPGLVLGDVVRAVRRYPDRLLPGYCPHPLDPQAIANLEAAAKMYGLRICGEWKCRLPLDDPRCIELFRAAGRLGLPVTIHIDIPWMPGATPGGGPVYAKQWYGGTVDNLERAMRACPQTVFIGHAPGFWREISGDADVRPEMYPLGPVTPGGRLIRLMETCPQLVPDLSAGSACKALSRDRDFGRDFLIRYNQRLMFARDDYDGKMHQFLQSLDLSEEVTENIYHGNAERLLRIDG
jgi:predicted TIM-barrel fold metal-dependent hydrolase